MIIAVDAMGGDLAPREIVRGALLAAEEYNISSILVGDQEQIQAELGHADTAGLIGIIHAPDVIGMEEHPAIAVRRKKYSSIVQATQLVRDGRAGAVVSAGNTGAAMTAALLYLGRIKGVDRPAIAGILPNEKGRTLMLDVGANVDCKPAHLLRFGIMGYHYAKKIMGINNPRVGLLSNGEEDHKGNEATLAVFPQLQAVGINFIGNIEGRDIFSGSADVIVCDGFMGNIVLKAGEGMATLLLKMVKGEITRSYLAKFGMAMASPALKELKKRLDYNEYGGAPFLGVNGVSIICHGSSTSNAVKNAIKLARDSVDNYLVESIRDVMEKMDAGKAGGSIA